MYRKPVIAIAGLACETSTFSPARTQASFFHPQRGDEIFDYRANPFLRAGQPLREAAEWKPALTGHALPGGIVTRKGYEELAEEIVTRLKDMGPLDGLWFDIHGAMVVEELEDAEYDLLRRIRQVVGSKTIISASMDLHGNVSQDLVHQLDLITCYRMAPHEDTIETRERAVKNLVDQLVEDRPLPYKAWLPIPILLPGEQTSTRMEPAKRIYAAVSDVEARENILDAAIWVGYAWADEVRNQAVVVVTGWNENDCVRGAEDLARPFWAAREEFEFVAPTGSLDECLDAALETRGPYMISDSGDNPTAGGAGDVTWGLTKILSRPEFKDESGPSLIYAFVPGPEAVETAVKAGVGATVTVTAGAVIDNLHAPPVTFTGKVHSIKHGDRHAEIEVVFQVGSVYAIITKLRKPYHKEHDFTELNLEPRKAGIVVVKIGYLEPELYAIAQSGTGWMLALTPGGVDQDLPRLGHKKIIRPMWPYDKVFDDDPDLTAKLIPMSNRPLS
ncbi:hypothetical protein BD324DRAFT_579375 [Kockovaella imperatae]|uniref:Microcystin LR degradation protein MlrC n=1 Tax=Kockovaella imperatae TaxID=4999 RepID=A0A1Y1UGD2_9TREE|nr:hypothetical protein BD324DRAFT_579375 [Kockovaella imperatae]ORX37082.1 hypothetical protein BD324DRAFT_579375 [Kockovaella imperatae]